LSKFLKQELTGVRNIFLVLGTILPIISSAVYVHAIYARNVRPQRMTRLLMMVITALSFAALAIAHDVPGALLAFTSFLPAILLWVISLKRGIGGSDPLDYICLGLCCIGLVLWLSSGDSFFGLVLSVVADIIACIPSLVKTIKLPHTEIASYYFIDVIAGSLIALVATPTVGGLLYPIYLALINGAFVVAIVWPRGGAATRANANLPVSETTSNAADN
jgi:hypothetical protein